MTRSDWAPQPGQWLISRLDSQVKDTPIDLYFLLQLPSGYAYGHFLVEGELPAKREVKGLLRMAAKKDGRWPDVVTITKGDPAVELFRKELEKKDVTLEEQPAAYLEPHCRELMEAFGEQFYSPSTLPQLMQKDDVSADDRESVKHFIPDSYDPCPCNSGKKYKFCCKKILQEITGALTACENGRYDEALGWMEKAKLMIGETGEILCRFAIVYSFFDKEQTKVYLNRCLNEFPNHPRAHYIMGINFKKKGQYKEAIDSYKTAIENYPPTDKYHLNEVWCNLGSAYYEIKNFEKAKEAWEKAVLLLPSDPVARRNLIELIYENQSLSKALRSVSPFVKKALGF